MEVKSYPNSTRIEETRYDRETGRLEISFVRGGTYEYEGVSIDDYEAMIFSPSIGKGFNEFIRSKYTGTKI